MKVEAMVFRFSKPSSSALTSPSVGDTTQGSGSAYTGQPTLLLLPSAPCCAAPRRARWGGRQGRSRGQEGGASDSLMKG